MKNCLHHVRDSYGSQACVDCLYSTEWISYTTRLYSTARRARASCFVLRGFTASHNIQNNVDLFFIASRHQAIIRTIMRHCSTTSRDLQDNVVLSFLASRYQIIVWTTFLRDFTTWHDRNINVLCFMDSINLVLVRTTLVCPLLADDITTKPRQQRLFILHGFSTNSVSTTGTATSLPSFPASAYSSVQPKL